MIQQEVVYPLGVVHQILYPVVRFACQPVGADEVHLAFHLFGGPVTFVGVEEVDTESGDDVASVALFLPVEGKRIKTVAPEIHHRVDLVLDAFAQPALRILIDSEEGIPAFRGVA
jgi:hypothetical protein